MTAVGGPDASSTATRVTAGALGLLMLGVLADIIGIVNFGTGRTLPDLLPPSVSGPSAQPSGESQSPEPSGPTSPQVSPQSRSPIGPTEVASTGSPADSAPSAPPGPTSGLLLTQVDPAALSSDINVDEPVTLAKEVYLHGLLYTCDLVCVDTQGTVEYAIPAGYQTFTSVVGVTDDAQEGDQVGTFEVYVDGEQIETVTARLGRPSIVEVPVGAGSRLTLVAGRPGTVGGSLADSALGGANAAAGVSNGLPDLAWGDPRFLP